MTTLLSNGRFFKTALIAAVILTTLTVSSQAQLKIGTIDTQKVFEGFFKKKQADAMLQERGADADKVIKGWEDDYKKANEEYRKLFEGANDQAVSVDEREKRKKTAETKLVEIREIEKSYTQFKREAGAQIDEMKRRWQERILGEIREVVSKKAKAGNFTMVFDSGTRFDLPIVLYSNGQNDLTDEVLSELNAQAPAGALTTGAKDEKPGVTLPKLGESAQKPGSSLFDKPGDAESKTAPPAKPTGRPPRKP